MVLLFARRRGLLAAAVTTLIVSAAAASALAAGGKPPVEPPSAPAAQADRDRDKLFDDLESRLAGVAADERVDVLVALDAPATAERVAETARRVGDVRIGRRFQLVDGFAASATRGQIEALSHVPWVAHVELDAPVHALNDSAQLAFGVTKARGDAPGLDGDGDGNPAAYSPGDLVAAVIDTGVHGAHLDLDGGKLIGFKDFVNGQTAAYDDNGHGTHVAATIAGDGGARADRLHAGVAPAAAIVGVKVLDANGSGSMSNVTAALEWVVQNRVALGIEVINLSLGAAGCSDGTDLTSLAVNNAAAAGLLVAAAAGNEGPGLCTVGSPGAASGALTVGAMADLGAGGFALASFSSRGKTADGRVKPDLVAPGVAITSAQTGTTDGYVTYDGTSMATPFVAGVALLAFDANRTLSAGAVRNALVSTAVDWGAAGSDAEYGAGRLDAYAALKSAGAPLTTDNAGPGHLSREGTLAATGGYADVKVDVTELGFPIAATMTLPNVSAARSSSPDFDLYLYNPSGQLVARSELVDRQENVSFRPAATGTYTVRVASYAGGGAYVLDVSGGFGGTAPAPAPAPAPVTVTASPGSLAVYAGSVRSGGASQLRTDDDSYFSVNSATSGTRVSDWYGRIGGVGNALRSLKVSYRGKSSLSCSQTVYAYNWTSGHWTVLDARSVGTSEVAVAATLGGTLADYVSGTSGDGEVAIRVRCSRDSYSFFTSADLLSITYER